MAPCKGGCPIEQDIPEYVELVRKGLYGPALKLITEKNPCPSSPAPSAPTGARPSAPEFLRRVRPYPDTKLVAAYHGYEALMASIRRPAKVAGKKAAIIGGGPTGIAAAYFLAVPVSRPPFSSGSSVWAVSPPRDPAFRITNEAIQKDIA